MLFGARFRQMQAGGSLGGRISRAKAYWLPFAIFFWFVVCPLVALDDELALPLREALGAFGAFMWVRGAAEMVMLYWTKNWRPPIGITHDLLCIALLLGVVAWHHRALASFGDLDRWGLFLVATAVVSLIVEIHHAWSFFVAMRGRTTGEDGRWFADDEDARFRQINRTTFSWNVVLSLALGAFLVRYLLGASS